MSFCTLLILPFYILFLLLLLLASCLLFESVSAAGSSVSTESINLFTPDKLKTVIKNGEGASDSVTVECFENIFLVATNDIMVAFAETKIKKGSSGGGNDALYLVAEHIVKEKKEKWKSKFTSEGNKNWKTLLAVNGSDENYKEIFSNKKNSAVVTKDNKIYFFVIRGDTTNGKTELNEFIKKLKFALVIGEISAKDHSDKTINWKIKKDITSDFAEQVTKKFKNQLEGKISTEYFIEAFAFLAGTEKKVVFVLKVKHNENDGKNITFFFQLDESNEEKLKLLHAETAEQCDTFVFSWENKKIIITTNCKNKNNLIVKESNDMENWDASNGPFSRLLDSLEDKKGFVTTETINKEPILFLTQDKNEDTKCFTYLWITDGTRIACVGEIVSDEQKYFKGSLLYTNDELFSLYKKDNSGESTNEINLKHHKKLENNIKNVLKRWKENDALVSALCGKDQESAKITCGTQLSTEGLVGFLSGEPGGIKEVWENNYDYVNAIVKKGTKVKYGFEFSGVSAGAQWNVGKESKYNLYNFAKYGFTLFASVTIDKAAEKENLNSVLGVCVNDGGSSKKCFRLWCTEETYWGVSGLKGADVVKTNNKCDKGKSYVVGMTLQNKNIVVYVDGDQLTAASTEKIIANINDEMTISYFYFGADTSVETEGNSESHVTVQNVLLYNQPFDESRLKNIKAIHVEDSVEPTGSVQPSFGDGESNEEIDEENTYGNGTPKITNTLAPTEEVVLTTNQRESEVYTSVSVMCGVWLMLFMVLRYQLF